MFVELLLFTVPMICLRRGYAVRQYLKKGGCIVRQVFFKNILAPKAIFGWQINYET